MRVKFLFAWYDLWIGAYINRKRKEVYVFPIPMFGVVVKFGPDYRPVAEDPLALKIRLMRESADEQGRIKW